MDCNSDIFDKLWKLNVLSRKKHMRFLDGGFDNVRGKGRILTLLKMQDSISTKEMSYLLGLHVSSLNETLLKLEKSGYIIREASDSDKRVILVKLTDKGREQDAGREMAALREKVAAVLTAEEKASLCAALDKLNAAFQKELDIDPIKLNECIDAWKAKRSGQ